MCVCLCFCLPVCAQRTGQSDQFKTVKATDFKFDVHVRTSQGQSRHGPLNFFEKWTWPGSRALFEKFFGALNDDDDDDDGGGGGGRIDYNVA